MKARLGIVKIAAVCSAVLLMAGGGWASSNSDNGYANHCGDVVQCSPEGAGLSVQSAAASKPASTQLPNLHLPVAWISMLPDVLVPRESECVVSRGVILGSWPPRDTPLNGIEFRHPLNLKILSDTELSAQMILRSLKLYTGMLSVDHGKVLIVPEPEPSLIPWYLDVRASHPLSGLVECVSSRRVLLMMTWHRMVEAPKLITIGQRPDFPNELIPPPSAEIMCHPPLGSVPFMGTVILRNGSAVEIKPPPEIALPSPVVNYGPGIFTLELEDISPEFDRFKAGLR
jgi:hypothetical protein